MQRLLSCFFVVCLAATAYSVVVVPNGLDPRHRTLLPSRRITRYNMPGKKIESQPTQASHVPTGGKIKPVSEAKQSRSRAAKAGLQVRLSLANEGNRR